MREHFGARRVKRRALVFDAPKAHWVLKFCKSRTQQDNYFNILFSIFSINYEIPQNQILATWDFILF